MKLHQLAAKPQLVPFVLDDEETIKEFGESVEFYSYDRQPIETFMKLANAQQQDTGSMIEIIRTLILDDKGKQIITADQMLPTSILLKAIAKIVGTLGK